MSLTSNKVVQVLFVVAAVLSIIVAVKTLNKKNCNCSEESAVEPILH
jgi:hypothetical protein